MIYRGICKRHLKNIMLSGWSGAIMRTQSSRLFFPNPDQKPVCSRGASFAREIQESLRSFVGRTHYPCIPAQTSLAQGDYLLGIYSGLGTGKFTQELGDDLLHFRETQKKSGSLFTSFIAVFPNLPSSFDKQSHQDEEVFEKALWRELSYLSSLPEAGQNWDPNFSSDPDSKNFCFSFGGDAFFVVGMHPHSSRLSRQFTYPTLIFNLYSQFKELAERGQYQPLIKANRKRDLKFQGSVNPMVEKYADDWEPIQFSGKENSADWKCPFHFGLKPNETVSHEPTLKDQE
jgi:uncharacterized protein